MDFSWHCNVNISAWDRRIYVSDYQQSGGRTFTEERDTRIRNIHEIDGKKRAGKRAEKS